MNSNNVRLLDNIIKKNYIYYYGSIREITLRKVE